MMMWGSDSDGSGLAQEYQQILKGERISQAYQAAEFLVDRGAAAVVVFGSTARGDMNAGSDLDLLVVWPDKPPYKVKRLKDFPSIEITQTTWHSLEKAPGVRWSFYKAISTDHDLIYDPDQRLKQAFSSLELPSAEARSHMRAVLEKEAETVKSQYDALVESLPDIADHDYSSIFAGCYRWSKAAVIEANTYTVENASSGRKASFATFAKRHPELAEDVKNMERLESFYLEEAGKSGKHHQIPRHGSQAVCIQALAGLEKIMSVCGAEISS